MKFHLFFLTITIQKQHLSMNELQHEQQIKQMRNELKERQSFYIHHM